MTTLDFSTMAMIVFAIGFILFLWWDRKNIERQGILLLRKTTKGRDFLINLAKRFPGFWLVYGGIAIAVGFGASVLMGYMLLDLLVQMMFTDIAPPLGIVLPVPGMDPVIGPGFIGVPFIYWIISIFLLILVHEGSHGVMAAREKVKIKALGWGALLILPLAFVEPDEEQLKKEKPAKQLRVFAAGSFGNFVLAGIVLLIIFGSAPFLFGQSGVYDPAGVFYNSYIKGSPAEQANMTGILVGIDDREILTVGDLSRAMEEIGSGKSINVVTYIFNEQGEKEFLNFQMTTIESPDTPGKGFIGILNVLQHFEFKQGTFFPEFFSFFYGKSPGFTGLLSFLVLINLGVGLFNLLPIGPLDGGRMWRIVLDKYIPKRSAKAMSWISWLFFFVLIFLFITPFIKSAIVDAAAAIV